jgi:hypothetical protein
VAKRAAAVARRHARDQALARAAVRQHPSRGLVLGSGIRPQSRGARLPDQLSWQPWRLSLLADSGARIYPLTSGTEVPL